MRIKKPLHCRAPCHAGTKSFNHESVTAACFAILAVTSCFACPCTPLLLGMLAFDDDAGFWLSHSAPKTPSLEHANYFDPTPFAQHFFCVSLPAKTLGEQVFPLLRMNNVFVDSSTPTVLQPRHLRKYADITALLEQTRDRKRPPITAPFDGSYIEQNLETTGGFPILAVAKRGCDARMGKHWSCTHGTSFLVILLRLKALTDMSGLFPQASLPHWPWRRPAFLATIC